MKKIAEMTEQEILALTEEDVEKQVKLRMMEEGVKIMGEPEYEPLNEVARPDVLAFTISGFVGYVFTDMEEAAGISEVLRNAKSIRKVEYSRTKLKANYDRNLSKENIDRDYFSVQSTGVYSVELYEDMGGLATRNREIDARNTVKKLGYLENQNKASGISDDIHGRVSEVRQKYMRLDNFTELFSGSYFPLSGDDPEIAIKYMSLAYHLTEEEKGYILSNYKAVTEAPIDGSEVPSIKE